MTEDEFIPCGAEPGNPEVELNTCIRQKGHDGKHYFWVQVPHGDGSNTWGLQIYNEDLETEWFLEIDGKMDGEEAGACVALLEAFRNRSKKKGGDTP